MSESKAGRKAVSAKMAHAATEHEELASLVREQHRLWNQHVEMVAAGDHDALARLYDETSPLVHGTALRILGDGADADEATVDVYAQVWRTASSFDSSRGSVSSWLVMLARSRALDRLRSKATRRERETPLESLAEPRSQEESPDETAAMNQQRRLVRAALRELSQEQREAIELAFFSGLSHSELAARLSQPLGTVKTRIRLGMMKLRQLLEPALEAH
jgi:RNA polymerase sigma-70 factor, ECF subfamily